MSDADTAFKAAVEYVKTGPKPKKEATNEEKLELYGLYKQATEGDNTASQPWKVQFEKRAKWDAWTKNKGMSQDDAKLAYAKIIEANKLRDAAAE